MSRFTVYTHICKSWWCVHITLKCKTLIHVSKIVRRRVSNCFAGRHQTVPNMKLFSCLTASGGCTLTMCFTCSTHPDTSPGRHKHTRIHTLRFLFLAIIGHTLHTPAHQHSHTIAQTRSTASWCCVFICNQRDTSARMHRTAPHQRQHARTHRQATVRGPR